MLLESQGSRVPMMDWPPRVGGLCKGPKGVHTIDPGLQQVAPVDTSAETPFLPGG